MYLPARILLGVECVRMTSYNNIVALQTCYFCGPIRSVPSALSQNIVVAFLMVDSAYRTLNSMKSYLSRFWEYYQGSPQLQKALETVS